LLESEGRAGRRSCDGKVFEVVAEISLGVSEGGGIMRGVRPVGWDEENLLL
jgi:hypothetical protein